MSTCGEPCDGCPNRAEHHLCDACCHDEVNAIQKENRELREKLEWQAACTKALMESTERLAAELKEARAEVERLRGCYDLFDITRHQIARAMGVDAGYGWTALSMEARQIRQDAYQRGAEALRKASEIAAFTTLSLHDEPCPRSELRSAVTQAISDLPIPEDEK